MAKQGDPLVRRRRRNDRRRDPAERLRGQAWLSFVLHKHNLTLRELASLCFSQNQNPLALLYKWKAGKVVPSKGSVNLVANVLPGSDWVYNLPLFDLLSSRPLTINKIRSLLAPYRTEDGQFDWKFPPSHLGGDIVDELRPSFMYKWNQIGLFERGDIYGFIALLGLMREKGLMLKTRDNQSSYTYTFAHVVRATPSLARLFWMRDHYDLLRLCIERLYKYDMLLFQTFAIDWSIIERQINSEEFRPRARFQFLKPGPRAWMGSEDPIILKIEYPKKSENKTSHKG